MFNNITNEFLRFLDSKKTKDSMCTAVYIRTKRITVARLQNNNKRVYYCVPFADCGAEVPKYFGSQLRQFADLDGADFENIIIENALIGSAQDKDDVKVLTATECRSKYHGSVNFKPLSANAVCAYLYAKYLIEDEEP